MFHVEKDARVTGADQGKPRAKPVVWRGASVLVTAKATGRSLKLELSESHDRSEIARNIASGDTNQCHDINEHV